MRLLVRHATTYVFDQPAVLTVQTLRLSPQPYDALSVLSWRVASDRPGLLPSWSDGYGNPTLLLTRRRPHARIEIIVEGEVETRDAHGLVQGAPEPLPPAYFLRTTPLTAPDDAISALAAPFAGEATPEALDALCAAVRARVDYRTGVTDTCTTAAAALAAGAGVCQDHAHVMVAACRALGWPARYVSGYLWPGVNAREDPASHAWAEAHVPGLGWHGFDPANDQRPGERHLRLAVGLDYGEAAPVRGVRRGLGGEDLTVTVRVDAVGEGR